MVGWLGLEQVGWLAAGCEVVGWEVVVRQMVGYEVVWWVPFRWAAGGMGVC